MEPHLDLATALDAYGIQKLKENPLFIDVGLNQIADMTLPQHEDFGKDYSFMLSGSDQAGHMQAASVLVGSALEANKDSEQDFETYLESGPGGLYCPEIKGLIIAEDEDDEKAKRKASSSNPETAIYIGQTRQRLDLDDRIDQGIGRINSAIDNGSEIIEESSKRHLSVIGAEYKDEPVERLKEVLPEFLEEHQNRRKEVKDYAMARVRGKNPSTPDFWPENPEAQVPEEERNETEWQDIVAAMEGEIVI